MIAPVLRWPGSKWRLAQWIIDQMPEHVHYLEPFFGSGAVFFCKQPSRCETLNDLDGRVVNFFRVMRDRPEELAELINLTPWARDEYYASDDTTDDVLEKARRFIVRCYQAFGATTAAKTGWAHKGPANAAGSKIGKWNKLPGLVIDYAKRLKQAQFENKPAIKLIAEYAYPDVLIYADPPYPRGLRVALYAQDGMTDADHAELLEVLDAHPGPVILSGYACPLYDDRLRHWTRLTHDATAERGKKRTEVLFMNPECVRRQGRLFD